MNAVAWGAVCGAVALVLLSGVIALVYNLLVRRSQLVTEAWSNVVAALLRRRDLVPALSTELAAAMQHQLSVDQLAASGPAEASVVALDEQPPQLATQPIALDLQRRLVEIEDDVQGNRLIFNSAVARYNALTQSFPTNAVASAAGFRPAPYFSAGTVLAQFDPAPDRSTKS